MSTPAPNDAFADALPIVFSGTEYTSPALDVTACTTQAGEPLQPTGAPDIANTVWWEFVVPVGGTYYFDTDLSDPDADTVLAVYSGGISGLPGLALLGSSDEDGVGGNHWSSCSTFVSAGYHLYVQVGAWAGPDANPPTTSLVLHVVGPEGVDVGGGGGDSNVDVALVTETDVTFDVDAYTPGAVPLVTETDVALPVAVRTPAFVDVPLVAEVDVSLGLFTGPPVYGFVAKVTEREEALSIDPLVQRVASVPLAQEHEIALPIAARLLQTGVGFETGGHLAVRLGIAIERELAVGVNSNLGIHRSANGSGLEASWRGPNGFVGAENALTLDLFETTLIRAPTSILVSVSGAIRNRRLTFSIDGVDVYSTLMPNGDGSALFSVPVPEEQGHHGEHSITVRQTGAASDESIFTLVYDPDPIPTDQGPDARPVEIPESIHPSGVRRWVLQDLMPGGLGSYVMPLNPEKMDPPAFERVLASKQTTAIDGQPHVYEGGVRPKEWSFEGYCPTEEMAETLRAFADLKRRFYVIDHRGRAWVFVATTASIVPRLQQNNIYGDLTDWVHDYTVNGVIFDRAEFA